MKLTFFNGLKSVFSSIGAVGSVVGGWVYFLILGLCVVLMVGSGMLGGSLAGEVRSVVQAWFVGTAASWLPDFASTLVCGLSAIVTWVAVVFLMCLIGGAVILVVLSPLLSIISDKMWVAAGNDLPHDSALSIVKSVGRGILVALLYAFCQICCLVLVFILSFIPVVSVVAPVLSVIVYAFFYGISFSDYALERSGRSAGQSLHYAMEHKAFFIGVGLPFALLMLVPFIGSYVALFFAPASAAAAAPFVSARLPQVKA